MPISPRIGRSLNCGSVRPRLTALLDGELSPEESDALNAHLEICTTCTALRDAYAATLRAASPLPVETVDMTETILARFNEEPANLPSLDNLTREQLEAVRNTQRVTGEDLAQTLTRLGLVSLATLAAARAETHQAPVIDLEQHTPPPSETGELLREIRAMREEMSAMRGEMDLLRRQIAAMRVAGRVPPRPASPLLSPYASPADLPQRERA